MNLNFEQNFEFKVTDLKDEIILEIREYIDNEN